MQKSIYRLFAAVITACLYMACKQEMTAGAAAAAEKNTATASSQAVAAAATCCWIATANQATEQIEVYDPAVFDWNTATARKWTWKPTTARGYNATSEIPLWYNPADVKLRNTSVFANTSQVIVTAGGRLATIAAYPSGNKIWTMGYSASDPQVSIHSAELLPNGNIALASADRHWIRVYSSSQPVPNHDNYDTFHLESAHATLWDPSINRLWVLGRMTNPIRDVLTALEITGTALQPKIIEDASRQVTIPGLWGHDLYPDYDNPDTLFITMNTNVAGGTMGVTKYSKSGNTFTWVPGAANRTFVKSIGNQPGANQLVETRPDNLKNPAPVPFAPCDPGWNTSTVEFYNRATGVRVATRPVNGACFYKARVWNPNYQ
jgi:hypothetical protein